MAPGFRRTGPILVVAFLQTFCVGQASELQGSWKGEFRDSLGAGSASLTLIVADSQTLSGTYQTNLGGVGTVAVKPQGNGYKFILTQTVQGCTGSFVGEFGLTQGKITGTYSGTDCKGWHENGTITMTADVGQPSNVSGITASEAHRDLPESARNGYLDLKCSGLNFIALFTTPGAPGVMLQKLSCGETVGILGEVESFTRVRTKSGQEGFVNSFLVHEGLPPSTSPVPVTKSPQYTGSGQYPLSLRVLQTEQVPYSVQYGGGGVSTNCSISGSTYTTGSATSAGNYTYGSAISNTDLSMRCNSYENPPMQWRHVLNAMLVVASNGNAYIMACDAAWRWSKCRGLITGDTFQAKMTSKGLAVQYYVNGKPKEGTYSVLQGKVLGQ
jgi:hypothetical protein